MVNSFSTFHVEGAPWAAYAYGVNGGREDLRVRLRDGLKEQFDAVVAAKRTTQQAAVNELVGWFVKQDPLLQSMILGQLGSESGDVLDLLIKRMTATHGRQAKGAKRARRRHMMP